MKQPGDIKCQLICIIFFLLTVLISCESVSFNVVHLDINVMYTAYHQQKQSRRSWLL